MKVELIPIKSAHDTKLSYCRRCFCKLEVASSCDGEGGPGPGDATVCLYCGHLMLFTEDLGVRDPTPEELLELKQSESWREITGLQEKFRNATQAAAFDLRPKR